MTFAADPAHIAPAGLAGKRPQDRVCNGPGGLTAKKPRGADTEPPTEELLKKLLVPGLVQVSGTEDLLPELRALVFSSPLFRAALAFPVKGPPPGAGSQAAEEGRAFRDDKRKMCTRLVNVFTRLEDCWLHHNEALSWEAWFTAEVASAIHHALERRPQAYPPQKGHYRDAYSGEQLHSKGWTERECSEWLRSFAIPVLRQLYAWWNASIDPTPPASPLHDTWQAHSDDTSWCTRACVDDAAEDDFVKERVASDTVDMDMDDSGGYNGSYNNKDGGGRGSTDSGGWRVDMVPNAPPCKPQALQNALVKVVSETANTPAQRTGFSHRVPADHTADGVALVAADGVATEVPAFAISANVGLVGPVVPHANSELPYLIDAKDTSPKVWDLDDFVNELLQATRGRQPTPQRLKQLISELSALDALYDLNIDDTNYATCESTAHDSVNTDVNDLCHATDSGSGGDGGCDSLMTTVTMKVEGASASESMEEDLDDISRLSWPRPNDRQRTSTMHVMSSAGASGAAPLPMQPHDLVEASEAPAGPSFPLLKHRIKHRNDTTATVPVVAPLGNTTSNTGARSRNPTNNTGAKLLTSFWSTLPLAFDHFIQRANPHLGLLRP